MSAQATIAAQGVSVSRTDGVLELRGLTLFAGTPDVPAKSVVSIFKSDYTPTLIRIVPSMKGEWSAPLLTSSIDYLTVAFDLTGQFDPAAKDKLIPTPMRPDPAEHPL